MYFFILSLDGSCFDTTDGRECVSCGNITTSSWRHDMNDHYVCSACHSPNRSVQRLTRHMVRKWNFSIRDWNFIFRMRRIIIEHRLWIHQKCYHH
jgi:hypothetical protein